MAIDGVIGPKNALYQVVDDNNERNEKHQILRITFDSEAKDFLIETYFKTYVRILSINR